MKHLIIVMYLTILPLWFGCKSNDKLQQDSTTKDTANRLFEEREDRFFPNTTRHQVYIIGILSLKGDTVYAYNCDEYSQRLNYSNEEIAACMELIKSGDKEYYKKMPLAEFEKRLKDHVEIKIAELHHKILKHQEEIDKASSLKPRTDHPLGKNQLSAEDINRFINDQEESVATARDEIQELSGFLPSGIGYQTYKKDLQSQPNQLPINYLEWISRVKIKTNDEEVRKAYESAQGFAIYLNEHWQELFF
ncbi:MAG: hypothetical protein R3B45_04415 [Bdellovibrionota bacterium]